MPLSQVICIRRNREALSTNSSKSGPCKRTQTQCPAEDYQPDPAATQESPTHGVYAPPSYETAAEAKDTTPYTTRSGRQVNQVTKPVRLDYGHWLSVA